MGWAQHLPRRLPCLFADDEKFEQQSNQQTNQEKIPGTLILIDRNQRRQTAITRHAQHWGMTAKTNTDIATALTDLSRESLPQPWTLLIHAVENNIEQQHLSHIHQQLSALNDANDEFALPLSDTKPFNIFLLTPANNPRIHDLTQSPYVDAVLNEPIRHHNLRQFINEMSAKNDTPTRNDSQRFEKQTAKQFEFTAEEDSDAVLLVEDNPLNQKIADIMLRKLGHVVNLASDGAAAIASCETTTYPLIFMDCQMPGIDGYEATRRIRESDTSNSQTPIIAITAHAMPGDRERCLAAGMTDYLTKPISPEGLSAVIERWLGRQHPGQG